MHQNSRSGADSLFFVGWVCQTYVAQRRIGRCGVTQHRRGRSGVAQPRGGRCGVIQHSRSRLGVSKHRRVRCGVAQHRRGRYGVAQHRRGRCGVNQHRKWVKLAMVSYLRINVCYLGISVMGSHWRMNVVTHRNIQIVSLW